MKSLFAHALFFLSASTAMAGATFEKTVHLSSYTKPVRTLDECYVIASGESTQYPWELMKADSLGNPIWTKQYTVSNYVRDGVYSLTQTTDSGFVLIGTGIDTFSLARLSAFIKTDKDGNLVFMKTYQQSYPNELVIDNAIQAIGQGYVLQGTSVDAGVFPSHVIIRTDVAGDTLWTLAIPLCGTEHSTIIVTSDSNYMTVTRNEAMGINMFVKFDDNGNIIWAKALGVYDTDNVNDIVETSDHGFILTGIFNSNGVISSTYVIKTDVDGNVTWTRTFSQPVIFKCSGTSIAQTPDGGYILEGATRGDTGNQVSYLMRMDPSGNILWGKLYDSKNNGGGQVFPMTDGGYYLVCATGGSQDIFIARTDNSGNTCFMNPVPNLTGGSPVYQTNATTLNIESADIHVSTRLATSSSVIELFTDICFSNAVNENVEQDQISISPNPFHASALLTLNPELQLADVKLYIYDINGRELSMVPVLNHSFIINRGDLADGIYLFKIADGKRVIHFGKILVE